MGNESSKQKSSSRKDRSDRRSGRPNISAPMPGRFPDIPPVTYYPGQAPSLPRSSSRAPSRSSSTSGFNNTTTTSNGDPFYLKGALGAARDIVDTRDRSSRQPRGPPPASMSNSRPIAGLSSGTRQRRSSFMGGIWPDEPQDYTPSAPRPQSSSSRTPAWNSPSSDRPARTPSSRQPQSSSSRKHGASTARYPPSSSVAPPPSSTRNILPAGSSTPSRSKSRSGRKRTSIDEIRRREGW